MNLYRLSREKYKNDLSGTGAKLYGGRWNNIGTAVLYTAENRSLSALEVAVHLPLGIVPPDYFLTTIFVPNTIPFTLIEEALLPLDWHLLINARFTKKEGDTFVRNAQFLAMKVPSASVKGDFNWLLNPAHPMFLEVKIIENEPFPFDSRLFVR